MTSKKKDQLVLKLRDSVDSQVRLLKVPSAREDVRRDCALQILAAITVFLKSWDTLKNHSNFPNGVVRDAFDTLLAEVSPGDAQVRATLLETISSLTSAECRQALLDVMPWTMPVEPKELEEATQQVLNALRQVLLEDSEALLPVLGCLSLLPLSQKGRAEAWNVALASLPVVSETDLPVLSRTLLCNVMSKQDASRALQALRTEFELLQSTDDEDDEDDPIPLIAHVLMGAFQDHENGPFIVDAYLDILKCVSTGEKSNDASGQEECTTFLVLDAVAMLALCQNHNVKSEIEAIMDAWIKNKAFPFSAFRLLLEVMSRRHRPGEPVSILYNRLVPSFLSLGVFLLLTPVRLGTDCDQRKDVHELLIDLHNSLDRDYQEEFVQCLLHLSEETSWDPAETYGGKKQRVRSHKELGKISKQEGLKLTADAVHSLLQHLALSARSSVARFKHVLVERLTSVTNDSTLDDNESIEQLCAILACLVEPTIARPGSGDGIDATEVMILLQKLLFTASYSAGQRSTRGESTMDVGRVIRGLILSTELIKSEALSRSDKECIHQWVHRILLPSTRRTVDPEIGSQGLRFLSAWSTWQQRSATEPENGHSTGSEQTLDMFQSFRMILANTGLIQMLSSYLERRRRPNEVVLGYTRIPSPFLVFSDPSAKRKKRDMVFCIHSYLRTSNVQHPSRWNQMTKWVYDLVDTYLTMGREGTSTGFATLKARGRTKWLPNGWLEASLELPSLNLSLAKASKKMRNTAKVLSGQLCKHEMTFDSKMISKIAYIEIANSLCEDKNIDEIVGQVESVLRVTLSFLLGIGLSTAVLRNTYAHLLSLDDMDTETDLTLEEGNSQRRQEILKLMQYQVMKLYGLKWKSETSIRLLEALATAVKRLYLRANRRTSRGMAPVQPNDSDSAAQSSTVGHEAALRKASKIVFISEEACRQTQTLLSRVFCSADFIDPEILVTCLVDRHDEATLVKGLKGSPDSFNTLHFKMLVQLRRGLLDNLCAVYLTSGIHGISISNSEATNAASIVETTSTISRMLPAFRKVVGNVTSGTDERIVSEDDLEVISTSDVSGLSASYFRMVKMILIKAAWQPDQTKEEGSEVSSRRSSALMDLLVQCNAKVESKESGQIARRDRSDASCAFETFEEHLHICEDEATALELIDILSVLSSSYSELAPRALEACWRVLHTVYTVPRREAIDSKGNDVPQVFQYAIESQKRPQLVDRVLSATIVKTATVDAKSTQDGAMLQHSVLLFWSLAAWFPSTIGRPSFDYLSKLTDELAHFLGSLEGSGSRTTGDVSSSLLVENHSKRSRLYASSIPSLTLVTFVTLFELVLHATVATFAISPHALSNARKQKSPFRHQHDMVQLLSRLLDVYVAYFHLFPRRMLSVVLGACKHLLSVCIFQVDGCVQWRNVQPILSVLEKQAGVHDSGSIKFLEELLQAFATWGAGKAMIVCQDLRQLLCPSAESDEDEEDEILASLPQKDKRFTSLMLTAQKTLDALRDVASAHNLVPPQWDIESMEKISEEQASKRSSGTVDADKGYHELDWNERAQTKNGGGVAKSKKRRRVAPTLVAVQAGTATTTVDTRQERPPVIDEVGEDHVMDDKIMASSPTVEDDESRASSDGFGVSGGKWGGDDDAEEDSSSGGLELKVSSIFQAA